MVRLYWAEESESRLATEPLLAECLGKTHISFPVSDRQGRRYCFNCVVETFQTQAYNLARRVAGDYALAEDGMQEAMLSAYRAFSSFRGDNLRSWLLRIVANACRDILKSRRARPSLSLESLVLDPQDPTSPAVELPATEESPEDYALRAELGRAIEEGLQALTYEQRLAVTLVDIQGLSYEEAAQAMGCSLGTVKSRVSRGRTAVRDLLLRRRELLPQQFRHDK